MDYLFTFGIVALAALIHSSFQVSTSVITLLSGHSLGHKVSFSRTMRLAFAFLAGTMVMTMLLLAFCAYVALAFFGRFAPPIAWAGASGLAFGLGLAVWAFYYRKSAGTSLWLPRHVAEFLTDRAKKTSSAAESFSLGLFSVLAEGLFVIPTVCIAALALIYLPIQAQLGAILLYTAIASLMIASVVVLVGSGHSIGRIQRWREQNKRFLQFAAGSALIVLAVYIYANQVMPAVLAARGGY